MAVGHQSAAEATAEGFDPASPRDSTGCDRVLVVEDTPSLSRLYVEYLKRESFSVESVETGAAALAAINRQAPQLMLLDLHLPDMHGMDVLRHVTQQGLPTGVVVITSNSSINVAVEAMRSGAHDYIVKPFNPDRLANTVRNTLERMRLARIAEYDDGGAARDGYCGFIGSSPAMQSVYRIIDSVAPSKVTVFITGESGTGKEVCAEAIHRCSPRADMPFVAINCGAIPRDLMESEIFGHRKGAFTGAVADRDGAATRADGGTLFLDEICEMAPDLQTKLLRFIQTGSFQRVGGNVLETVDFRIVCATNRDPLLAVQEGRFREDLYYRLHVVPIHLPPLRERGDDVSEIASHLLAEYAKEEGRKFRRFSADALALIGAHPWPGNVRQLQNVVRNAVVLPDGDERTAALLPTTVHAAAVVVADGARQGDSPAPGRPPILPLWRVEKQAIEAAIAVCDGNIPRAAALLEISASTIYRKRLAW